tara:strand:+ start:111 stop:326 length:216 start_codon:yes stop_codon:yes gene_type:complete
MEEQPANTFPTLTEIKEMAKAHEDFKTALQEHVFPPPKPYVEEEGIKRTTPSDRESTIIARARLESTVGAL